MVTLRISNLAFGYASRPVFSGVTLDIKPGEVVSVVGRNGAGKSTLLRCINHILTPSDGSVHIGDTAVASLRQEERAKRLGYLAQKCEQLFPSTVFDVVLAGRFPHSPVRFTRHDELLTAETLAMMELDEFAHRQFNRLSGGEQQQVLIARALVQGAGILLFDEPTNNLDLKHQLQIMQLIRTLSREKGIISVLAIHDLNFAAAYSDRIVILHERKLFAQGSPAEVFTADIVETAFGVPVKVYDHHGVPHIALVHEYASSA